MYGAQAERLSSEGGGGEASIRSPQPARVRRERKQLRTCLRVRRHAVVRARTSVVKSRREHEHQAAAAAARALKRCCTVLITAAAAGPRSAAAARTLARDGLRGLDLQRRRQRDLCWLPARGRAHRDGSATRSDASTATGARAVFCFEPVTWMYRRGTRPSRPAKKSPVALGGPRRKWRPLEIRRASRYSRALKGYPGNAGAVAAGVDGGAEPDRLHQAARRRPGDQVLSRGLRKRTVGISDAAARVSLNAQDRATAPGFGRVDPPEAPGTGAPRRISCWGPPGATAQDGCPLLTTRPGSRKRGVSQGRPICFMICFGRRGPWLGCSVDITLGFCTPA